MSRRNRYGGWLGEFAYLRRGKWVGPIRNGHIEHRAQAEPRHTHSKRRGHEPSQRNRPARSPQLHDAHPANIDYGATMPLVLLVEDDSTVRGALTHALSDAGHAVQPVATGLDALREITANRPDLVVLDLGLPDIDGIAALRMVRAICDVPVIVATARRAESDVIRLLNAGADDYVIKPFSSAHLAARIAAVLRRGRAVVGAPEVAPPICVGPLSIDVNRRSAELEGRPLRLTRREFDLLAYLAARAGRVVPRRELVTEIWQQPYAGTDQTLDVHVSWLRRKLGENAASPRFLHTVRGVGLMLVVPK